jgi:hypothetical protein
MQPTPQQPQHKRFRRRVGLIVFAACLVVSAVGLVGCQIVVMPGTSFRGALPAINETQAGIRDRLRDHVHELSVNIGQRNREHTEAYSSANDYIVKAFKQAGYTRVGQVCAWKPKDQWIGNIETEVRGTKHPEQVIIVGAHYDTVVGSPGANDNGSGVAALLEIARLCQDHPQPRTIRFVAFFNEESVSPCGSYAYAKACKERLCRERHENIDGMICLETLGYYADAQNSQVYPFPFSLCYPSTGNFVAFVSNSESRPLLHRAISSFRAHASFPSRGAAVPDYFRDAARSDHAYFWQNGYRAIMVTDTANFRYPYYHTPEDTEDKIDFDRLARVTEGLFNVVKDLAQ